MTSGRGDLWTQGSTISAAIAAHLQALVAARYAAVTIATRRAHLRLFSKWGEARGLIALDDVTPCDLDAYRAWLSDRRRLTDGRPLSWSTHTNQLTGVRMLLAWATRAKWLAVNPAAELSMPRAPKRLPRAVLSVSETERVLREPDIEAKLGLRDRAILEVLYSTGIRRMELVGLDLPDLDCERQVLFVREGKGRKDRVVPIGVRAIRWIERYLDSVRPQLVARCNSGEPDALFLSARGTRIRPTRLTERLHRYIQAAGVRKPGSVHIFRHTMATLMHDAGADIRDLQEILGHAQLSTTAIYTRISIDRLKAVHARTHPANLPGDGAARTWSGTGFIVKD